MRAFLGLAVLAACGGGGSTTFDDSGGTLAIASCGYSVTTKPGAEAPKPSGGTIGKDPTPEFVHLGFIGDPRTTMVAQWRTADETTTAGFVRYAAGDGLTADQLTEKVQGIEFGYRGTGTSIYRVHQAHMCDLQPGTTYSYQVGATSGGKQYLSPVYTFHTAPDLTANPDAEAVIGVLGDSRDSADIFGQLATMLAAHPVDMLLYTGDSVLVGLEQDEYDAWFTAGAAPLANLPLVTVDGNHEANAINYYAEFANPGDQENFGFDYGSAHFTIANDTPEDASDLTTTTLAAITSDFQASANARWKILVHHQPMWSTNPRHGSNTTLQASWGPVVDQYGIDVVLNGHDHQYEITYPLKGGVVQPSNATGTVYVVSGGAGADLDQAGSASWQQYAEETYNAGIIDVRRDQLTVNYYRMDGTAITPGFAKTKP